MVEPCSYEEPVIQPTFGRVEDRVPPARQLISYRKRDAESATERPSQLGPRNKQFLRVSTASKPGARLGNVVPEQGTDPEKNTEAG